MNGSDICFSTCLIIYPTKHTEQYKIARFLRLTTGAWVSMSGSNKVYLPLSIETEQRPIGIELSILDSDFYQEISKSDEAILFLTRTLCLDNLRKIDLIKEIIRVHREG